MSSFFGFESEPERLLTLMPMAVRLKLDTCRLKLSLKQWQQLPLEVRQCLLDQPCDEPGEITAYHELVVTAALSYTAGPPEPIDPDLQAWSDLDCVPHQLVEPSTRAGVAPPTLEQWRGLTPLQRFALVKLTRPGHPSSNFLPAIQEFRLDAVLRARA